MGEWFFSIYLYRGIHLRDASASRSQAGVMESDDENEREGGFGRALAARLPAAGEAHALGARGGRARPGGGVRNRARRTRGLFVKRIFGTKAEPQRIVATRPLCRVQHPVPHSSRLQGIHRVGPVTCDRVRHRPKLGVLAAERPTR